MEAPTPGGIDDESPAAVILGLILLGTMLGCLTATGLGIAGLCQKDKEKVFSILGIIFSIGPLGITLLLIVIGTSFEQ